MSAASNARYVVGIDLGTTHTALAYAPVPTDDAALKLLILALRNISKKWQRNVSREWLTALPHLTLLFGDRFTPIRD